MLKRELTRGPKLSTKSGNESVKRSGRRLPLREDSQSPGELGGQEGYILLAVLFLVVMVLVMLAIAAPKMAADIERDREMELVHRGKQYVRAIKLYYKKFGAYPPNLDALEKTNEIRFLRKRYKDPITGKDEWHLIHFGENKTPSYGFFGQPIGGTGGSTLAGVGPGGVGNSVTPSSFGSNSAGGGLGGSSIGGSSIGGSSLGGSSIGGSSGIGTTSNGSGSSGTDPNSGSSSGTGTGGSSTGTGTDPNSASGSNSTSGFGGSGGQTFGGGGIIGVESTSPKLAILTWKKKTHFNEWEFWYDPNADLVTLSSSGGVGQPVGSGGINSTGTASPSQFNQPPAGSNSNTNSTPTQPQPQQQPQ
jgi:type II secretory pathway pseudopilin PulG